VTPGGSSPGLEKGYWLTPSPVGIWAGPNQKFPYEKMVDAAHKLSKNRRLQRKSPLFSLHFLSYASPFL